MEPRVEGEVGGAEEAELGCFDERGEEKRHEKRERGVVEKVLGFFSG